MSIIVKEGCFEEAPLNEQEDLAWPEQEGAIAAVIASADLKSDTKPDLLDQIPDSVRFIRIEFPSSADGRGFSLAKALRDKGFSGHLRAYGHVLADQYPLALRSGFDDVEISDDQAARQGEDQWLDALGRVENNYQSRLMQARQRSIQAA